MVTVTFWKHRAITYYHTYSQFDTEIAISDPKVLKHNRYVPNHNKTIAKYIHITVKSTPEMFCNITYCVHRDVDEKLQIKMYLLITFKDQTVDIIRKS